MDLPSSMRNVFVVSADISAEEHILTQAALQRFVDNSLSKTINFPAGTIEEDVAKAFMMAWKLGCKGITVYITGSRESVVLETNATKQSKEAQAAPAAETIKIYGEDEAAPRVEGSKDPAPASCMAIPTRLRPPWAKLL
ncbi:MAG: hypothetical protein AB9897_09825 [Anaerolineaceae bacterium]